MKKQFCLLLNNMDFSDGTFIVPKKLKRRRFQYRYESGSFQVLKDGIWHTVDIKNFQLD